MVFSWDEEKRNQNLKKHRLDFKDAHIVFGGLPLTSKDERFDYREQRFITIGLLHDKFVVIAHTIDGSYYRIISMRKATKYEEVLCLKSFQNH
ncbi:MAG: BrnT family toxin [Chloroflexota bacterium]